MEESCINTNNMLKQLEHLLINCSDNTVCDEEREIKPYLFTAIEYLTDLKEELKQGSISSEERYKRLHEICAKNSNVDTGLPRSLRPRKRTNQKSADIAQVTDSVLPYHERTIEDIHERIAYSIQRALDNLEIEVTPVEDEDELASDASEEEDLFIEEEIQPTIFHHA